MVAPQQPQAGSGEPTSPDLTTGAPLARLRALAPWLLAVLAIVAAVVTSPIVVAVAGLGLLAVVHWHFEARYEQEPPERR